MTTWWSSSFGVSVTAFLFTVAVGGLLMFLWVCMIDLGDSNRQRWEQMCAGPARYDAMREANDMGRPNPCG